MSDRWKMNRIGFVNFWLYDEEDFEFVDGKLLLRGQNGSGKSITTQSFIPFVLDGDRTPSRLDPFGSSDRRMEYYFLGEEGRDDATGYLFLEFKKADTEEYRTIGIGQRAKRGKPMDFWGFVLLDGKRIGYDLWLYKEVGSSKIPLDKREMKATLGEDNFFTDSQSEYKKYVNQYIFGFRKAEQYEQFIKLLVKVRAPKLSKEFKPTKVYEILNDSLQTLTDEDLRAMVDAMEKMDEIQDSLEILERAFADIKVIRTEYTRYNQYMLGRKAQAYLQKNQAVKEAQRKLDRQKSEIQNTEIFCHEKEEQLRTLEERKVLAETERNGLLDMDLEGIDHKLEEARTQKETALEDEQRWESRIQDYRERILREEQKLRELQGGLEQRQQELGDEKEELEETQEILQWDQHSWAVQIIEREDHSSSEEVVKNLNTMKKLLEECRRVIEEYEKLEDLYDEAAAKLEQLTKGKIKAEQDMQSAQEQVTKSIDQWITDLFEQQRMSAVWKPGQNILKKAECAVREYQAVEDAGRVQKILREDYEGQRQSMLDVWNSKINERNLQVSLLEKTEEELTVIRNKPELEPERDEWMKASRTALEKLGIAAVPFYKTVEFSEKLDNAESARMEAQLQKAGILDALVVTEQDMDRIRKECPEFQDTVLFLKENGNSNFNGLTVSEELPPELKRAVKKILGNIYLDGAASDGIRLGKDGWFRHGMLFGKAEKEGEAEFIGILARKRRKEQRIHELEVEIKQQKEKVDTLEKEVNKLQENMEQLEKEYQDLPGFTEIDVALDYEKECGFALQQLTVEHQKAETQENKLAQEKNGQYQKVLQKCRPFSYGRTEEAYQEAVDAVEEYIRIWQEISRNLLVIENIRDNCTVQKDGIEQAEEHMDEAFAEKDKYSIKVKQFDIQIHQYEEYLNRPDIAEKAKRLKELREELKGINEESFSLSQEIAVLKDRYKTMKEAEPAQKEELQREISYETAVRSYFEEELSLKLVMEREGKSLLECAKAATEIIRESDRNREAAEMFQSLYQVYQRHNGSLTSYGTSIENCFEADQRKAESDSSALRNRVRIVSTWNGKKVYLEEFYKILKAAIDETELLIQKKDRELFEDILSQTISQQLTDKIAESRKWVSDMSRLMRDMDTSMGLSFSLEWKSRKSENDEELDTVQLEEILLRDRTLLTMDDIEKVAAHFRSKIRMEKQKLEEDNGIMNYMDLVRDALDYRKWFEFRMFFKRGEEQKKPLTNAAFNRFSGGEKAMAMYVPLFAAVNAQYKKAENKDHPRMIALDEAFAGVDDKNISSMFEMVQKLDFDYIMNSQALWGCFETVKGLRIAELLRPQNSRIVSVIRYTWNGKERMLDEQ